MVRRAVLNYVGGGGGYEVEEGNETEDASGGVGRSGDGEGIVVGGVGTNEEGFDGLGLVDG